MDDRSVERGRGLPPVRLAFYLGNTGAGSFSARWDGDALRVEETGGGNFSGSSRVVRPSPGCWTSFWEAVRKSGACSWNGTYAVPHGCCGVTYWLLDLEWEEIRVSCSGEDMFPAGDMPGMTPGFRAILDAVRALCRCDDPVI